MATEDAMQPRLHVVHPIVTNKDLDNERCPYEGISIISGTGTGICTAVVVARCNGRL
jgi:hypothetical protein